MNQTHRTELKYFSFTINSPHYDLNIQSSIITKGSPILGGKYFFLCAHKVLLASLLFKKHTENYMLVAFPFSNEIFGFVAQ